MTQEDGATEYSKSTAVKTIDGWLLPSTDYCVRILMNNDVCLSLAKESIKSITIEESEAPNTALMRVNLHLSPQPILLDIGPGAPMRGFYELYPRPFALMTRKTKPAMIGHDAYIEREASYFQRHGLVHHRSNSI